MSTTNLLDEALLSVKEAMTLLNIGRTLMYELMERGQLPYTRIGGRRRIPRALLNEFVAKNTTLPWGA